MTGSDITQLLQAAGQDDEGASQELFDRVYGELRRIAGRYMAGERTDHTLQPTALVHEVYLRLLGAQEPRWENRGHFFATAAEAMRRILIEHARRKLSLKRGGDREQVELPDLRQPGGAPLEELLDLDAALDGLEARDPAMAQVVKLRYFAGLTIEETAQALDLSPRSVTRSWTSARAWLRREIARPATD